MSRQLNGVFARCLEKEQSGEIEALRLSAAVTIFIWHVWHFPMGGLISVFFVMSGFLIGQGLMYHISAFGGKVRKQVFLKNIAYRLLSPLLVVSITVFPLVLLFAPSEVLSGESWRHLMSVLGMSNLNIPLSATILPAQYMIPSLTHEWTVGVQLQAYIIMLLIFSAAGYRSYIKGSRKPLLTVISVTAILSIAISLYAFLSNVTDLVPQLTFAFHHANTFSRLYQFLAGAAMGVCIPEIRSFGRKSLIKPSSARLLAVVVIAVGLLSTRFAAKGTNPGIPELVVVMGCVILLASGVMKRATSNGNNIEKSHSFGNYLNRIGGYTYALYLTHWPVYALATMYFIPSQFGLLRGYSYSPSQISDLGATLVIVLSLAATIALKKVFEDQSNLVAKDSYTGRNLALTAITAASIPAIVGIAIVL